MKLSKAVIHKYKSFLTEQSIDIEEGITRIVGKNESGKSALLEALAKTNYFEDNKEFRFDKNMDYPRGELNSISSENPKVITCHYTLSEDDMIQIETDLGGDVLCSPEFSVATYYDNSHIPENMTVDFEKFKDHVLVSFEYNAEEKGLITTCDNFESLLKLARSPNKSPEMSKLEIELSQREKLGSCCAKSLEQYVYFKYLRSKIPKFWYFSDYFSLPHRILIADLANDNRDGHLTTDNYNIVKALFESSGLKLEDIQDENNFEVFKAKLESTSNSITDKMFEYWTTNDNLEIKFEIEHLANGQRYLNIRVYNPKHRVTLPLRNRSKGFVWFFSFLVWFDKIQGKKDTQYILLLDEPGLSLHAAAQKDLLRFIEEKLSPEYQVVYTTHSPFMIESLKLDEVRTVYDTLDRKIGSVISDARSEMDSDTLFPLQAALGYTIAQNLYISENNLLVEGISDLIYLQYFSSLLHSKNREGLMDSITIVPVGGADKIATFISLMRGNELNTVCLLDTFTDQKARTRLDQMVTQNIIQKKKILFYHEVVEKMPADIEDIFEQKEYVQLYNAALSESLETIGFDPMKAVLPQIKQLTGKDRFNHYTPAIYLASHSSEIEISEATLSRFEQLFQEINSMMK